MLEVGDGGTSRGEQGSLPSSNSGWPPAPCPSPPPSAALDTVAISRHLNQQPKARPPTQLTAEMLESRWMDFGLHWLEVEVDTDIIGHPPVLCVANCTDPTGLSRWGLQARDVTVADIATQHVLPGPKPILTRHCCCLNVKRPAGLLIHERKTA